MDLSDFKPVERIIEILNPKTGSEIGLRVSIISLNDERVMKVKRKIQDEKLRLEMRGKNFKSEDIEENRNALIFAAITGWEFHSGLEWNKEKSPVLNQKNLVQLLTEHVWVREQIEEAISDEQAFFQI